MQMNENSEVIQVISVIVVALIGGLSPIIVELIRAKASQKEKQVDIPNGIVVPEGYRYHTPTKPKVNLKRIFGFTILGGIVGYIIIFIIPNVSHLITPTPTQMPVAISPTPKSLSDVQLSTATNTVFSTENPVSECQQIQIPSCVELALATNPQQNKCLNENGEILITLGDIADMQELSGWMDIGDCTCKWEWKAKNRNLEDEFIGSSNNCHFSVPLSDEVSVIYLTLTIADQPKLYKIVIQ